MSRQRAWGVPIAVFVREKGDGSAEILQDDDVNERIAEAFETEGADAWYRDGARERFLGPTCQRGLGEGRRHPRRLVRFRLDPCLRAGRPRAFPGPRRHQAQGRRRRRHRDVSGRLGPASRLVPVLAAGELRHARPRAVRRRADPRLHARRERPQDVEVARQHRRAAGRDQGSPAPTSCGSGSRACDYADDQRIGPEILKTRSRPIASCATPSAGCSARSHHFNDGRARSRTRTCRSSSG